MNRLTYYIIIFVLIFSASVIIARGFYWLLSYPLKRIIRKSKTKIDDYVVYIFKEPLSLFIVLAFLYLGKLLIRPVGQFSVYLQQIINVLLILNIGWLVYKCFSFALWQTAKLRRRRQKINKKSENRGITALIKKIVAIIIFFIVVILSLENVGANVTSLLAGLGIGGLAIALAAKETLSNLFGVLTLVGNPIFNEGDTIEVGGITGVVKEIGIMNTIIQKFDTTELIMSNQNLFNQNITNISRRKGLMREIRINLDLSCNTEDIKRVIKEIKLYLKKKSETLKEQHVLIDEYTESRGPKMILRIVYWIDFKNYDQYLGAKNAINLKIHQLLQRNNLIK